MSLTDPTTAADDLARRLAPLDLQDRVTLIAREVPGRLVFTTSLGIEDQVLTHALAMAKLAGEAVVDFTFSMAKREVTFLRGSTAIRRL